MLYPELQTDQLQSLRTLRLCADVWGRESAVQTLLAELASSTAPVQLVQRIACVALTQQSGRLLATAVHRFVPDLLQREIFPQEIAGPTAGIIAKALTVDDRNLYLGQDLVQLLLVLSNVDGSDKGLADGLLPSASREELKAASSRLRERLRDFRGGILGNSDFTAAVPAATALRGF